MALTKETLRETHDFLSSISKKNSKVSNDPTEIESIYYILAKEFGITLDKVDILPIPYLISLINTFDYVKKEEEKEMKKSLKRKNGK